MKKSIVLLFMVSLVVIVSSCSTFNHVDDAGAMTYQPNQLIGKVDKEGWMYAPFGIMEFAPSVEKLREEGYSLALEKGIPKKDVMFVNEKYFGHTTNSISLFTMSWWSWWIISFGDYKYSAEVISVEPIK
jgi:hypothetical protein